MSVLPAISPNENQYKSSRVTNAPFRASNKKTNSKQISSLPLSEKQVILHQSSKNNLMSNNSEKEKRSQKFIRNGSDATPLAKLKINVDFSHSKSQTLKLNQPGDANPSAMRRRGSSQPPIKKISIKMLNSPSPEKKPMKKSNVSTGGVTSSLSRRLSSTRTDSNSHNSQINSSRNPSNQRKIFNSGTLPTTHELNVERVQEDIRNDEIDDEEKSEKMARICQWLVNIEGANSETEQIVIDEGPRPTDMSIHIIYDGD